MPLRWIAFSRVSMQRAGVLVALAASASDSRAATPKGLTETYSSLLRRTVDPKQLSERRADELIAYINDQRLWQRYGRPKTVEELDKVEVQDVWLSDSQVRSTTGAITKEAAHEPPQLAASLRLIRQTGLTRTDRGRALMIAGGDVVDALRAGSPMPNPMVLNVEARAVLVYALLEADFDFVQAFYRALLADQGGTFSRASAARCLERACLDLYEVWSRRTRRGEDRKQLLRLRTLAGLVARERGSGSNWGGGRPPEQTSTLRLEPYVDLELIKKPRRHTYDYELSERQHAFFTTLVEASSAETFLETQLFSSYAATLGIGNARMGDAEIWKLVRESYRALRTGLGYVAFIEVVLLAIGRALRQSGWFDIADGLRVIRGQQHANPRNVKFGIRRGGGLSYMRIMESKPS